MFHGNDAGDSHITQDCSDAAMPRHVHRSSSGIRSIESPKARKTRLAREQLAWESMNGPVTVRQGIPKKVPKKA